eukprot:1058404-Prorocentrum_minimum.AAC.1
MTLLGHRMTLLSYWMTLLGHLGPSDDHALTGVGSVTAPAARRCGRSSGSPPRRQVARRRQVATPAWRPLARAWRCGRWTS